MYHNKYIRLKSIPIIFNINESVPKNIIKNVN